MRLESPYSRIDRLDAYAYVSCLGIAGRLARKLAIRAVPVHIPPYSAIPKCTCSSGNDEGNNISHQGTMSKSVTMLGRRAFLQSLSVSLFSTFGHPFSSTADAAERARSLGECLLSTVRLRDALQDLSNSLESGNVSESNVAAGIVTTNGDIRRIVKTLLKASPLRSDISEAFAIASNALPELSTSSNNSPRSAALAHAQSALEFLDQVFAYYETTELQKKLNAEQRQFAIDALHAAKMELDDVLNVFPQDDVRMARTLLTSGET